MIAPTPEQRAREKAREIIEFWQQDCNYIVFPEPEKGLLLVNITDALLAWGAAEREAALEEAAQACQDYEPYCVNGHDRCFEGADKNCPYCVMLSESAAAIRALKTPAKPQEEKP